MNRRRIVAWGLVAVLVLLHRTFNAPFCLYASRPDAPCCFLHFQMVFTAEAAPDDAFVLSDMQRALEPLPRVGAALAKRVSFHASRSMCPAG